MVPEMTYSEMKAIMPNIKQLLLTRHYIQCATLCRRLLTRNQDQIHPVHLAYLHFYLAMSHDAMAREATIKYRQSELDLAEEHYLAAIAALTPSEPPKLDAIPERSPTSPASSPASEDEHALRGRRVSNAASVDSDRSVASSATSLADDDGSDYESPSNACNHVKSPFTATSRLQRRRPAPIITSTPRSTPPSRKEKFSADLSSFISMVQMHLHSVQELKATSTAPTVRFSFARSRSSTVSSRPMSRDSFTYDDSEMDQLKWTRKRMNFRPRFDPASVQKLCTEALAECGR